MERKTQRGIPALTLPFTKAGCKSCSPLIHSRKSPSIRSSQVQVVGWQHASEFITVTLGNSTDPILQDLNNILNSNIVMARRN